MGWSAYGLYDGDGTQTCHSSFMKWAGWKDEDAIYEAMHLLISYDEILCRIKSGRKMPKLKTRLTDEMKIVFLSNINKVLRKMPKLTKFGFKDESDAIEWQMLLALFVDNELFPSKLIIDNGILATEYLLESHCNDFDDPARRKAVLRRFIKKVNKMYGQR